jgi:glycosyltransferase involved in cell wall biosynthesis
VPDECQTEVDERPSDRILFFGSSSVTNRNALEHLVKDIVPRCRTVLSRHGLRFRIAGRFEETLLERLRDPAVEAVGEVSDMDEEIRAARFVVLPIRAASGTRTRILEAARWGKAVVTTPIGAEGLELPGDALVVRESGAALAEAIEALVEGRLDAARIGRELRRAVLARYGEKRVAAELYEQLDAFDAGAGR